MRELGSRPECGKGKGSSQKMMNKKAGYETKSAAALLIASAMSSCASSLAASMDWE